MAAVGLDIVYQTAVKCSFGDAIIDIIMRSFRHRHSTDSARAYNTLIITAGIAELFRAFIILSK